MNELTPGTPEYYQAKLDAMNPEQLVSAFEAVVRQAAGMPIGHPDWTTTTHMVAIARNTLVARLPR